MQKLYKVLNKPLQQGLLGVEVEVEANSELPIEVKDWITTHDGSLRGLHAAEYVLRKPLSLPATMAAIDALRKALEPVDVQWSFRTSVHVHMNVLNMTKQQIDCFIYSYLLLEEVLVAFCGKTREGNRFCLRVRDAENLVHAVSKFFANPEFAFPNRDMYRYSSLNLDALNKFGSLEFRGMRGTVDRDVLDVWVNALVRLRSFSMKYKTIHEISDVFVSTPDDEFLELVFGKAIAEAITPKDRNLSEMLSDTYSLTMALLLANQGIR